MIIKSLSRKDASFAQLFDYLERGSEQPETVVWNINVWDTLNKQAIVEQFLNNSKVLKTRKGGNVIYHEVISLKRNDQSLLKQQITALHTLSYEYLKKRGEKLLGYGRLHVEKHHLHYHLMLSSNELDRRKPFRLSKEAYADIQRHCDRYLQQHFPELKQESVYLSSSNGHRIDSYQTSSREFEYMNRSGKKSRKRKVREDLKDLLGRANEPDLEKFLWGHGYKIYHRGKTIGVTYNGENYRLNTLGLLAVYQQNRLRCLTLSTSKQWSDALNQSFPNE